MIIPVDANMAELTGILLGDGSISIYPSERFSTYYRCKVTLDSREGQYISHVSSLMETALGSRPKLRLKKNEHTAELLLFEKRIVLALTDFGFVPSPKWGRARIPAPFNNTQFGRHVLRGYFDTDGCVVRANNNGTLYPRLEMKISPGPFQNDLIDRLAELGFRFGVYAIGDGKVRVQLNGERSLQQWVDTIGFNNQRHLDKVPLFV
ncbi:MAG: LAGLIDADG family homing endonuclease [Nanoarchaeota archaeon]